jgi:hypothetical protein
MEENILLKETKLIMKINQLYEKEIVAIILYTSLFFIIIAGGLIVFSIF